MPKPEITPSGEKGFTGRQKAMVFSASPVGKGIKDQLEKKGVVVGVARNEHDLNEMLQLLDPELILLEIDSAPAGDIVRMVANIFGWMRERAKTINKALNSPSGYFWYPAQVFLYRGDFEITAESSVPAAIADTDELVRQCELLGDVRYLGVYSSFSFLGKLRQSLT